MTPVSLPDREVTIGIDIGTTSVKAVAADADGNVVARARIPHRLVVPAPDRMEHDAVQAWRRGPRRALAALGDVDARAACVTAMVPSLTAVDRHGIPRTPGLLYGDERGRVVGGTMAGEGAGFLRWTAKELPDAHGFWPAPAVANYALAGEAVADTMTAVASIPDQGVLDECGVDRTQLPRLADMGTPIGKIDDDTLLACGGIDAVGDQLVAGADNDGDVLVLCGTTLITWAVIPEWRQAPGVWTIPHTTPGKMLIGGPSNAGGLFLNWATALAGKVRHPVSDPWRVPVWMPYVRGERTPLHDPDRRSVLDGLDLTHDAAALRRAAFEAAGFVVRHHLDLGEVDATRIVATGGGTRVAEWIQALADCTRLPVDVAAVPETAALGGAFISRVAAGLEAEFHHGARWARTSHRVEPDPTWEAPAAARYERFRELAGPPGVS